MSFVIAAPEMVSAAATDLTKVAIAADTFGRSTARDRAVRRRFE